VSLNKKPSLRSQFKQSNLIYPSVFFTLALCLFFYSLHQQQEEIKQKSLAQANDLITHIDQKIQKHITKVDFFTKNLTHPESLSQSDFTQFAHNLELSNPEIINIAWGALIMDAERKNFEQELQRLYAREIKITFLDGLSRQFNAPNTNEYLPIKYVYPLARNQSVLGMDPSSEFAPLNALHLARSVEKTMLNSPVIPVQTREAGADNWSVISYTPVYKKNITHKQFIAYLALVIDFKNLIDPIINGHKEAKLKIKLIDITSEQSKLLYSNLPNTSPNEFNAFVATDRLVFNKVWSLQLYSKHSSLIHIISLNSWVLLFVALLGTLIIIRIQRLSNQRNIKNSVTIKSLEQQLATSQTFANLLSVTFESHQGIIITDARAKILRVNNAFTEVTGYAEHEVIGKNPNLLSSGRQSSEFYQMMWAELLTKGRFEGEVWNRHKNGSIFLEQLNITVVKNTEGDIIHYVSMFSDITKRKREEEKIKHLAFYDALTLLPNRRLLLDRLEQSIKKVQRSKDSAIVLSIDLDDFNLINASSGYQHGDEILIQYANRLTQLLRQSDTVARLDSDKFMLLLPVETMKKEILFAHASSVINKILLESNKPFLFSDQNYDLTVSIGISFVNESSANAVDILRQAESALYKAKANGKNGFCFYQDEFQALVDSA